MIQNANTFQLIVTMAIEVTEIICKHEKFTPTKRKNLRILEKLNKII